jgi:hypothetical protein
MRSELAYEIGATVLVEIDPKHQDIDYHAPLRIAEAIVTSCSVRDDGKTWEIGAKFCEHEIAAITYYGTGVPWGGIVHPLTSKGLLVRYQNLRRESDAALASANARSRTLLDALGAVGKGLGDDLRASLARIEAALARSR